MTSVLALLATPSDLAARRLVLDPEDTPCAFCSGVGTLDPEWERMMRRCPVCNGKGTVSSLPVWPTLTTPCPECEGYGAVPYGLGDCPGICGGSGTVPLPLMLAVEQERIMHDGSWDGWRTVSDEADIAEVMAKLEANGYRERRQAIVGEARNWRKLDVWADEPRTYERGQAPFIVVQPAMGHAWMWFDEDDDHWGWSIIDEPWAADLRPGQTVVMWDELVELPEPVTTVECPTCKGIDPIEYVNDPPYTACPTCGGAMDVPLALSPGKPTELDLP